MTEVDILGFPVSTLAGTGSSGSDDGPFLEATFGSINQMAFDQTKQNIYVADTSNHLIRKLSLVTQFVSTVSGNKASPGNVDGPLQNATYNSPAVILVHGNLIFVGNRNGVVRQIDLSLGN